MPSSYMGQDKFMKSYFKCLVFGQMSRRARDLSEIPPRPRAHFGNFPRPRAKALGLGKFPKYAL